MTNSNSFKTQDKSRLQVLVISKEEIDKEELDSENDLKDFVLEKAKIIKEYKEVFSDWNIDSKYFVMIIKT